MLRNKIGKPSQTSSNNDSTKPTESKGLTQNSGIKAPGGFGSIGSGIKTPSLIGVKPFVKPSTTTIPLPSSQKQINPSTQKEVSVPQPSRQLEMKTEQERLAELVSKRAAEMKKEYQMINKISSQVGSEKKGYFKEYPTTYGHVLNIFGQKSKEKSKENLQNVSKNQDEEKENKKERTKEIILFKVNAWDEKNLLKQYLQDNFKKESYL